jgi:hypothetical protein
MIFCELQSLPVELSDEKTQIMNRPVATALSVCAAVHFFVITSATVIVSGTVICLVSGTLSHNLSDIFALLGCNGGSISSLFADVSGQPISPIDIGSSGHLELLYPLWIHVFCVLLTLRHLYICV